MAAIFLLVLVIVEISAASAQISSNISLGSSLSPTAKSRYWLSESGQFAFGFYPKGNGFGVGIWFDRIPETIVWMANRDDPPFPGDVTLILSRDGGLILQEKEDKQTSITNAPESAYSATMLNSGNFVLYNSNWSIIWQTFLSPTDTILQGQRLSAGQKLVSSISKNDHGSGKFELVMQKDGNLVQYPVDNPSVPTAYWNTATYTAGDDVSLNLDNSGQLYLVNATGFNIRNVYVQANNSEESFHRATIDADGIFRLYSVSLKQIGEWSVEWESSDNRCDPYGICGVNSFCTLMDQDSACSCPPGFDFINHDWHNLGCKRSFSLASCGTSKNESNYTIRELDNVTWEDNPYDILSSISKEACKENCLNDCSCEAAIFTDQDQKCRKQKFPLRYGRREQRGASGSLTTLIKIVPTKSGSTTIGSKEIKEQQRMNILISSLAILTFALLVLAISSFLICRYRVWKYRKISGRIDDDLVEDISLRSFTFDELKTATNGFTDEVGKGAFATVFKGVVSNGRRVVAIKRLEKMVAGEREFRNEIKTIGKTHHKNLVRLLGYCHDATNRLLVYEFMTNGSLADFLFKSQRKPSWEERTRIAQNVARGILYLHEECETQIIHCDIKPENILIDENKCPKVADFGLAKLLMPNQTRTFTGIRGTRGYVAPEWHKNLPVTVKADVYSFGIMLLEIICCRRSLEINASEHEVVLSNWVYDCFQYNELDRLVQDEEVDKNKLERMVRVGLWCILEEPSMRPSVKKVVLMLEGTVDIPVPPSPSSFLTAMN